MSRFQEERAAETPLIQRRPEPHVLTILPGRPGPISAYVGLSIDACVNMADARPYRDLDRHGRFRAALADQRQMLTGLLGFQGRAALDLRLSVWPNRPVPIEVSMLGRTWADSAAAAVEAANDLKDHLVASLPPHVLASTVDDPAALERRLDPYPDSPNEAALLTKRQRIARPSRSDAGRPWYFSTGPLNSTPMDWGPLYKLLAGSSVPVTVSVATFPVAIPAWFRQLVSDWAGYYGRLARPGQTAGGLYSGPRPIAPDPFAVEAEQVFVDYLRQCSESALMTRIQVAAPRLPAKILEALPTLLSPLAVDTLRPDRTASSGYEVRWLRDDYGRRAARWNLSAVDCYPAPGRAEIWAGADRPPPHLDLLSVLGDVTDAACALPVPTAVDGVVPGFAVQSSRSGDPADRDRRVDVVVLTVTQEESDALRRALDAAGCGRPTQTFGRVNTYSLYGPIGGTMIAHVRCSMGSGGAAGAGFTVSDAIRELGPWAVLAVGIAFGVNPHDQPIGQLLLSEKLTAYELQRVGESVNGELEIRNRGASVPGSATLLGRFRDSHLSELGIDVAPGEILSGEKLIDSAAFKTALLERFPEAIGGEMEGAGVVAASLREPVDWLVVKAVCDYAASKREDKANRQRTAADVAARAVVEVLGTGALVRHT